MKRLKTGKPFRAFIIAAIITFICGCSDSESGGNDGDNRAPEADIQTVSVLMNESVAILLTANDPDGDDLTYIVDTQPENGTIEGTEPELTYTPGDDFTGSDSFAFHVNDGASDSGTAAVSITVIYDNAAPVAQSRSIVTHSGSSVNITLEASDAEGDDLVWIIDSAPEYGELNAEDIPMVTYTPPVDYAGNVSFTFHVNGGGKDSNTAAVDIRVSSYRIYVDIDAASGGDGFSWDTAFQHPMDAIDASLDGDRIWIAEGSYIRKESGDKILLAMNDGVFLYGGFAGFEAEIAERDYESNVTTLDGEESVYHVVTGADNAALDGFTITGGNADNGIDFPHNRGGGMYNENCSDSLVIANCNFTANSADYRGGGIYNDHSSPTITSCAFTSNKTKENGGGGVFNWYSSSIISDCVFSDNEAFSSGGGMVNYFCEAAEITGCTFSGNMVKNGDGGGMYNHLSPTKITNCEFIENISKKKSGGAMSNYIGLNEDPDLTPRISNCIFNGNMAKNVGGGIFNKPHISPIIEDCIFINNIANSSGAGIFGGESPIVRNCEFTDNISYGCGAGLAIVGRSPIVEECTFNNNSASSKGGGVYIGGSGGANVTKVHNCTFSGNSADEGGALRAGGGNVEVFGCEFTFNSAEGNAGGMSIGAFAEVEDCRFIDNTAIGLGGGAYINGLTITLAGCEFEGNTALNGGGIYSIGSQYEDLTISITDCLLKENSASDIGGGLYISKIYHLCSFNITSCDFLTNTAANNGGAMFIKYNVQAEAANCVFAENTADCGGGIDTSNMLTDEREGWAAITNSTFYHNENSVINIGTDCAGVVSITNSILWGGSGTKIAGEADVGYSDIDQDGYAGNNGNIRAEPSFISADSENPGNSDLHLSADSPCIDAAKGDVPPDFFVPGFDKDKNSRYDLIAKPNTGRGDPDYVDMGAYEYIE